VTPSSLFLNFVTASLSLDERVKISASYDLKYVLSLSDEWHP